MAFIGGSAGANLVLAAALALRDGGDVLPVALVTQSAPTDLAMTGASFASKASADPILGKGLAYNSYLAYTSNGATNARNLLVSPLYGNPRGLPPTLLQVGTQEILLSDSTRMAERMRVAGVAVRLEVWPGMFHGWQGVAIIPEAHLANQHVVRFMLQYL